MPITSQESPELLETPPVDPAMEAVASHSNEEIETAVLQVLSSDLARAEALMSETHQKWSMYRKLKSGKWCSDITTNSPVLNELYIPRISERITFALNAQLPQSIPDPQTFDHLALVPTWVWPGMELWCEAAQALLRQKFGIMRPDGAVNYYEFRELARTDQYVYGNSVGIVGYDVPDEESGDGDPASDFPQPGLFDPLNWFPTSITCATADDCAHFFHDPITEDESERIPYLDQVAIRERKKAQEFDRVYGGDGGGSGSIYYGGDMEGNRGPGDEGWVRKLYFGPLPWRKIADALNEPDWTRDDVVAALDGLFKLDMGRVNMNWWSAEWIDDYLITVRPYPIDLPAGRGPIIHETLAPQRGSLLGQGAYELYGMLERFYNEYNRYLKLMGGYAAQPPLMENRAMIDPDWLQSRLSGDSFLEPGEVVPMNLAMGMTQNAGQPYTPVNMGLPMAMEYCQREMARLDEQIGSGLQVSSDYTGNSTAKTATQSANNLNQSRTVEGHQIKRDDCGGSWRYAANCFTAMCQAILFRNAKVRVAVSDSEAKLKMLEVTPEDVRSLGFVAISVNSSASPSSRTNMVAQLLQLMTLNMSAPPEIQARVNMNYRELNKEILSLLGTRGKHRFFDSPDEAAAMLSNVIALLGPGGVAMLPPQIQMQLGLTPPTVGGGQPLPGQPTQPGQDQAPNLLPGAGTALAGEAPLVPASLDAMAGVNDQMLPRQV